MDEIRIRHENETKKAQVRFFVLCGDTIIVALTVLIVFEQERDALNTTVHDIELAIDLGRSAQINDTPEMTGTEVLLKRVADQVSNKSDSGGILKQIKEFNAFLERAALVLESRKV
jgi:hypothetical protein